MAPITWTIRTALTTAEVAEAARAGGELEFNVVARTAGKFAWRPLPSHDGGVFDAVGEAPAWSARLEYRHRIGDGVGCCDILVMDRGGDREVMLATANSLGQKGVAKKLLAGVRRSVENAGSAR